MRKLIVLFSMMMLVCGCAQPAPEVKEEAAEPVQEAKSEELITYNQLSERPMVIVPVINIDSEDAKAANELFEGYGKEVMDCLDDLGDGDFAMGPRVCVDKDNDIISVCVGYITGTAEDAVMYFEAVNLDMNGKALTFEEVLKRSEYGVADVEETIRQYAYRCKFDMWEREAFTRLANEQGYPGLGDPSEGWGEELDSVVKSCYRANEGDNALNRYPTIFYDSPTDVSVVATIPYNNEVQQTLIRVGKDIDEIYYMNSDDPFVMPFGPGALSAEAAEARIRMIGVNDAKVEKCVMYMGKPFYYGTGDDKLYLVDVFDGSLWEYVSPEWTMLVSETNLFDELLVQANEKNAMALVYHSPDAFEEWSVRYHGEFDINDGLTHYEIDNCPNVLVFAPDKDLTVKLVRGEMADGKFTQTKEYGEKHIPQGKCLQVWYQTPQDGVYAMILNDGNEECLYIFNEETDKIEYLNAE